MDSKRWILATALSASGLLCAVHANAANDGAVPPPQQQGPIVQTMPGQPQPVISEPARRFLYFQARGGALIPIVGNYANAGALGGFGNALVGVQTRAGFSLGLIVGGRYATGGAMYQFLLSLGGVVRYTFLRDVVIHPFVEAGFDIHLAAVQPNTTSMTTGSAIPVFGRTSGGSYGGLNAAAGAEYDISANVSLELACRANYVWGDSTASPGGDFVIEPWLGFTYYR
jgi:hypothetical protein